MAELSAEGRTFAGKLCGLLYLSASLFVGMHFLVGHFNAYFATESTSPSSSVFLCTGGVFFAVAVAVHIFFAWRYPGQFNGRWAVFCAVYFAALNGTLFGLPVILSRTTLSADARSTVYEAAAGFFIVALIMIWMIQFILFIRRGPRRGTWRTVKRGPATLTAWEAGDLNSEEQATIDGFLRNRMGELSKGLGREEEEDFKR